MRPCRSRRPRPHCWGPPRRTPPTGEPPQQWWQLYQDAALDQLVQQAFRANTDLAVAAANLSAARALLEGARAGRYPQTQLSAGTERGRDAVTDEILEIGGQPPETFWFYDTVLWMASYEVDLFGHVRRAVEAARADTDAALAARDIVTITVAAETTRAYAQVCALGEAIAVAKHSVEVVTHEQQITMDRRDAARPLTLSGARAGTGGAGACRAPAADWPAAVGAVSARAIAGPASRRSAPDCAGLRGAADVEGPNPGGGWRLTARAPTGCAPGTSATSPPRPRASVWRQRICTRAFRCSAVTGGIATQPGQVFDSAGLTWGLGPSNQLDVSQSIPGARAHPSGTRGRAGSGCSV